MFISAESLSHLSLLDMVLLQIKELFYTLVVISGRKSFKLGGFILQFVMK